VVHHPYLAVIASCDGHGFEANWDGCGANQAVRSDVEDLQLADESTLDLLSPLARRRVSARLMLLATYRPADVIMSGSHLKGLKQDLDAVTNGLTMPWSSGPVEGRVNHIKMIKRQMFGRAGLPLLRKRVLLTARS
jgi:transposase